ncbi:MAG: twin-arginine translocase TatA/TatE family subunit [Candidatus Poseidoniaceae archaeon]|jgi:sec-independent protein translocase protein TatA|nr:twin-arginine translocase TatA/TatE family subunit [Candidatus Poseidoniaceae archaeon]
MLNTGEIMILVVIFFLLFGAERLPKLARAAGQSKGEFQKGMREVTGNPDTSNTENDLESGGKTAAVKAAQDAEAKGIDPSGMTTEEADSKSDDSEE